MKTLFLLLFISTHVLCLESFNYVNKKYKFTSELALKNTYFTKISPHFYRKKLQYFTSFDNLQIAYRVFEIQNAKGIIVISSGRTEGMLKYQELIYDFNNNGFSVYILDHRGQGNSQRLLADRELGHVVDFSNYVKDMKQFVSTIVKKDKKRILLGHSMGGAIASLYVEQYDNDFNALVLSSPMHQPEIISSFMTKVVCSLVELRKKDLDRYIIGEKPYDDEAHIFEINRLTHSKIRYEVSKIAYDIEPKTKIGGPSVRWVHEACKASAKSVEQASRITIPVLLLQAQNDVVVNKKPQNKFCKNVGKGCKIYQIDGGYHELFVEKDSIRNKALTAILDFISKI